MKKIQNDIEERFTIFSADGDIMFSSLSYVNCLDYLTREADEGYYEIQKVIQVKRK